MAQLLEAVRVVDWICVRLVDLSVIVGVGVIDERGHEVGSAGMRKGVGGRVHEVSIESLPFLKNGGGRCCILLHICNEGVVVIIIELVDNSGGIEFRKLAGRVFA